MLNAKSLKRDVVLGRGVEVRVRRGAGGGCTLRRGTPRGTCACGVVGFVAAGSATGTATFAAAEELHHLTDYAHLRALLAGLFVIPSVELQAALDEHGTPLLQVLAGELRLASP